MRVRRLPRHQLSQSPTALLSLNLTSSPSLDESFFRAPALPLGRRSRPAAPSRRGAAPARAPAPPRGGAPRRTVDAAGRQRQLLLVAHHVARLGPAHVRVRRPPRLEPLLRARACGRARAAAAAAGGLGAAARAARRARPPAAIGGARSGAIQQTPAVARASRCGQAPRGPPPAPAAASPGTSRCV
jgi:hypothetical protein